MIGVMLADGFEEIEALTPVDLLRRVGLEVKILGVTGPSAVSSRGVRVFCDGILSEQDPALLEGVVLPGGSPGYRNLAQSTQLRTLCARLLEEEKLVAAICAAPTVLAGWGLLTGRKATCYPGMEPALGQSAQDNDLVIDGNLITSRGPGTAMLFSLALVERLKGAQAAQKLARGLCLR